MLFLPVNSTACVRSQKRPRRLTARLLNCAARCLRICVTIGQSSSISTRTSCNPTHTSSGSVPGYRAKFKGKKWLYVTAEQLSKIIGDGDDADQVKKELVQSGILCRGNNGRYVVQRPVFSGQKGNKGYRRVHAFRLGKVSAEVLGDERQASRSTIFAPARRALNRNIMPLNSNRDIQTHQGLMFAPVERHRPRLAPSRFACVAGDRW